MGSELLGALFRGFASLVDTTARLLRTYMMKRRMESMEGFYKPGFEVAKRWAMCTAQGLAYLHGRSAPMLALESLLEAPVGYC